MEYPRYRRLGLPTSSAPVESTIKPINRRMKGSEKFWLNGGAEALLQLRAAYLSEDDRAVTYWSRPRPYARAAGSGRVALGLHQFFNARRPVGRYPDNQPWNHLARAERWTFARRG
jgi:hypothetical protein